MTTPIPIVASPAWPLPPGMRATRATRALAALYEARPNAALSEPEVEAALAVIGVAVNKSPSTACSTVLPPPGCCTSMWMLPA